MGLWFMSSLNLLINMENIASLHSELKSGDFVAAAMDDDSGVRSCGSVI